MFKIGDIVYVNTTYNIAEKCEIIDIFNDKEHHYEGYSVHSLKRYGTFGVRKTDAFATKKEAIDAYTTQWLERKEAFKAQMLNMKDVVNFALSQISDEYASDGAISAIKERASELLDIPVEEFER